MHRGRISVARQSVSRSLVTQSRAASSQIFLTLACVLSMHEGQRGMPHRLGAEHWRDLLPRRADSDSAYQVVLGLCSTTASFSSPCTSQPTAVLDDLSLMNADVRLPSRPVL